MVVIEAAVAAFLIIITVDRLILTCTWPRNLSYTCGICIPYCGCCGSKSARCARFTEFRANILRSVSTGNPLQRFVPSTALAQTWRISAHTSFVSHVWQSALRPLFRPSTDLTIHRYLTLLHLAKSACYSIDLGVFEGSQLQMRQLSTILLHTTFWTAMRHSL